MEKTRNASFELLRIICMFLIVLYHLFCKLDYTAVNDSALYSTLQFPLHIAVVCFVLISGYFGINLSLKKVLSFCVQVLFYNVFAYVVCTIIVGDFTIRNFVISFLPFSHNQDLWFVRTYLYLLLLSPILNNYLKTAPPEKFRAMLLILTFISVYLGLKSGDVSLKEGKNFVNFMFLYFVGHGIRNKLIVKEFTLKSYVVIFLLYNVLLLTIYYVSFGNSIARFICKYGWNYNSPLLIMNAIFFFMIFTKLTIKANVISAVAKSVFPIYLIHSNLNVQNVLWPFIRNTFKIDNLIMRNVVCAIFIMLFCVVIDKCLVLIYGKIYTYSLNKLQNIRIL